MECVPGTELREQSVGWSVAPSARCPHAPWQLIHCSLQSPALQISGNFGVSHLKYTGPELYVSLTWSWQQYNTIPASSAMAFPPPFYLHWDEVDHLEPHYSRTWTGIDEAGQRSDAEVRRRQTVEGRDSGIQKQSPLPACLWMCVANTPWFLKAS